MIDRNYFKGKRIAMIGLGPHGEMVEDAKFLIKSGCFLSVYDLRSEARMKRHLVFLRSIGLANYVCGYIPVADLLDADLVILSHEYPRNSSFLSQVVEKGIAVEYPETLFLKLSPPLTIVGIIGSAGRRTVMSVLAPMLKMACERKSKEDNNSQNLFIVDLDCEMGVLTHLKKAKNGDILLMRITSRLLDELNKLRISPQVAIFTSLPPENTYVHSPFEILENQTYNNFLIANDEIIDLTRKEEKKPRSKMLRTKVSIIPPTWDLHIHIHDRMNIALALQAARLFKVNDEQAEKVVFSWKPQKHHLEFVKKIKGVEYYDDSASQNPHSTIAGMNALVKDRNLIVISGGRDTGLDYHDFRNRIMKYAHTLILLPGSGTIKERKKMENLSGIDVLSAPQIEEAVRLAHDRAKPGDRVLFSPGFAFGGIDAGEKERGDRFVKAVRNL